VKIVAITEENWEDLKKVRLASLKESLKHLVCPTKKLLVTQLKIGNVGPLNVKGLDF
jgi:hypothetical protein